MYDVSLPYWFHGRRCAATLMAFWLALSVGMFAGSRAIAGDAYAIDTSKNFSEIVPLTGVTTPIFTFSDAVSGIAFGQDRNLHGLDHISDSLVRINLATGETTSIRSIAPQGQRL